MTSLPSPCLGALSLMVLLAPAVSTAGVTVTWTQEGNQVTGTFTGSFSEAELAAAFRIRSQTIGIEARYDTTPSYLNITQAGDLTRYDFLLSNVTVLNNFTRDNNYSGSSQGDTFGFAVFDGYARLFLSPSYVAGSSISGVSTFQVNNLGVDQIFRNGEVIKLTDGDALVTYYVVPEASTYGLMLGGLVLAGAALRRRRKV